MVRRYLSTAEGEHSNAVFFELELKGLSGLGSAASEYLRQSIPGYQNEF